MKRNLLVLAVVIVVVLFFTPHNAGAQCPQDTADLGICDTLYVEVFDCDHEYQAEPGSFDSVRVAVYVTHDSNTFLAWPGTPYEEWVQDSICAFVIPLTFWHQPPGCADSVILPTHDQWNNDDINPSLPWMNRSMFRHIVDTHTGDTTYNRLLQMVEAGKEPWNVVIDIESHSSDGDSGHARLSLIRDYGSLNWWEGERELLATLTFHVYMSEDCDTTEIGIDSMFWPPGGWLAFTRYDAKNYIPRHFLPVKDTIYIVLIQPPQLTCPDHETQHTNGTFTTATKWSASDPDSNLVMPPTCQAPGGPIPTCNVNVDSSTGAFAEGTIGYSVTDHCQTGTYYIMLTVMDDQEMADTCFLPITLDNHPPVLASIGDKMVDEGQTLTFTVSATDPDGDSLTYSASNLPNCAAFLPTTRTFIWTPGYDCSGVYSGIHFGVSDACGDMDYEDITITVNEVNRPPRLYPTSNQKVNEGETSAIFLLGEDPDGDSVYYSASNLPPGATFDPDTGIFVWTPTCSQYGTYPDVHFEAHDINGGVDYQDISIQVLYYPIGDVNDDGTVGISDVVYLINYLFVSGSPPPVPLEAGDVNWDEAVNVPDVVYLINYLFVPDSPPPCEPIRAWITSPMPDQPLNGRVYIGVSNLSNAPVDIVYFEYSADSIEWMNVNPSEEFPPWMSGLYPQYWDIFWGTDTVPSGDYLFRAVLGDTNAFRWGMDTISITINKAPICSVTASYDSATGIIEFDGTASYDPDGEIVWLEWEFCDSTFKYGPIVYQEITEIERDTCKVTVTIVDDYGNEKQVIYLLIIGEEGTVELVQPCQLGCECKGMNIVWKDTIPGESKLSWNKCAEQKDGLEPVLGDKKLGPADKKGLKKGGRAVAMFFMVDATVEGDLSKCKQGQDVKGTYWTGIGVSETKKHKVEVIPGIDWWIDENGNIQARKVPDTVKVCPYDGEDLCDDGYGDPRDGVKEHDQANGFIRWLDAPGQYGLYVFHFGIKCKGYFESWIEGTDGKTCRCKYELEYEYDKDMNVVTAPKITIIECKVE